MTTTAKSAIAAATRPVFYTADTAAVKIALWKNNRSTKPNAPVLTGNIGGVKVAGYVHQGPKNKFIQFVAEKKVDGKYQDIATANVVAGAQGFAKLVVRQNGKDIWAESTREASHEILESLGMNIEKMVAKQDNAKAAREAKTA